MKFYTSQLHNYYLLTKPGIIYGNLLTTLAGFFVGAKGHIAIIPFVGVIVGTAAIIGSACVFNNYMDRSIDEKMERTKKRPSVTGLISLRNGMIFATTLGMVGCLVLLIFTNFLTAIVGLIGFIDYVLLYGYSKRKSIHGTLVGSISGSMPIVAGYTAITNRFDTGAILLFFILASWQMPHFYAIAIYRLKDYANAHIPVLPVKNGISQTKGQILFYTVLFLISTVLLSTFHYAGILYGIVMAGLGAFWLFQALRGFIVENETTWARKMFFLSLIIITILSIVIPLDAILRNGILLIW